MKYANSSDFITQEKPSTPTVNGVDVCLRKLHSILKAPFRARFDPTMVSETQRREMGIQDCEVDWYKAQHGPLVK